MRLDAANWAVLVGALVRLLALPFAEDLYGDAPVRSDIAAAWARNPGLWWSYRDVLQFGPFPFPFAGVLVKAGFGPDLGPRLLSCIFGIAGILLAAKIGRRFGSAAGAGFAAWAVALSPLHIQASTTAASEAIFLAFALAVCEAALAHRTVIMPLCAFAASTTRYDAWLWIPPLGLAMLYRDRFSKRAWAQTAGLLLGPLSILLANHLVVGRALAPLQHISADHAVLAAALSARFGAIGWRLMSAGFWLVAPLVVLTPGFGFVAFRAFRRLGGNFLIPEAMALPPPLIYAARALLFGTFMPLLRMATAPAALLAVQAAPLHRNVLRMCVAGAVVFDLALLGLATFPNPLRDAASRATPVTRLPDDLRAGVQAVRSASGPVAMDQSATWEDIVIAHAAGRDRFQLYAPTERVARIVAIRGAPLDRQLRETGHALGRACARAGEVDRVSWWDCRE